MFEINKYFKDKNEMTKAIENLPKENALTNLYNYVKDGKKKFEGFEQEYCEKLDKYFYSRFLNKGIMYAYAMKLPKEELLRAFAEHHFESPYHVPDWVYENCKEFEEWILKFLSKEEIYSIVSAYMIEILNMMFDEANTKKKENLRRDITALNNSISNHKSDLENKIAELKALEGCE